MFNANNMNYEWEETITIDKQNYHEYGHKSDMIYILTIYRFFKKRRYPVPPHAGDVASETVELEKGLLPQFSHAMEPHLRKLGMPTRLERSVPELLQDFTVCEGGKLLTPAQASILVRPCISYL